MAGQDDTDVNEQLADEAAEAAGRLQRQLAAKLKLPAYQPEDGAYGAGSFVRGGRLSSTAVTLSSDDSKAYSVTKCGSITIWDIENMSRCGSSQHAGDWLPLTVTMAPKNSGVCCKEQYGVFQPRA